MYETNWLDSNETLFLMQGFFVSPFLVAAKKICLSKLALDFTVCRVVSNCGPL
jgi:hypothetical protein